MLQLPLMSKSVRDGECWSVCVCVCVRVREYGCTCEGEFECEFVPERKKET